jgi:serine/threonine protein kinase
VNVSGRVPPGRSKSSRGKSRRSSGAPIPEERKESPTPEPLEEDREVDAFASRTPTFISDYRILRKLDGGGMADVYLAHKISSHGYVRRVLIKRVKRTRPGYQNLEKMLLDEARATSCFDHPNIVGLLDLGEDDQGVFLALEYVDGTDLRWVNNKLRQRKEALPFELACFIAVEVLRGLHHAHQAVGPDGRPLEIVHRDVNPSNVLISFTGHVKLADFGVVRMRDRLQAKTEAGLVKGKYAYLAPEYIAGESCSHQTDVYAAGVMLFELLCGRECFTGSSAYEVMWKIVNRGVPLYRLEREGVPEDLARIVHRSVNPVPERRYETAQDMANALETWLMRSGKHATPWVLSVFFTRHGLYPSREERSISEPKRLPPPGATTEIDPNAQARARAAAARAAADRKTPRMIKIPISEPPDWEPPEPTPTNMLEAEVVVQAMRAGARISSDHDTEPSPIPSADDLLLDPSGLLAARTDESEPRSPHEDPIDVASDHTTPDPWSEKLPANTSDPFQATTSPSMPQLAEPDVQVAVRVDQVVADREFAPAQPAAMKTPPSLEIGEMVKFEEPVEVTFNVPDARTTQEPIPTPMPELHVTDPIGPVSGGEPWTGKLEEVSVADALELLAKAEATGKLEFRCGLIWKRLQLDRGTPVAITSNMGMELIGEHLVKARLLSRRELDRALQAAEREGSSLTAKLLELGLIDRAALEVELGKNIAARIIEVLEWRWGVFEFEPEPIKEDTIRPKLDLEALITDARSAQIDVPPAEKPDESGQGESAQSKLKEAFKRARSIAQNSGKGRVDTVRPSGREPSSKR